MLFLHFLLLLSLARSVASLSRVRRDIYDNIALDDPDSPCRNGGIFTAGRCHCIQPHTGKNCEDYICVHGMSVGKRFDPHSLFFNRPCICDKGWTGDLCENHPSEKCNNHGEWKSNHCECIGFFFGPTCQYTSKCVMGTLSKGRCLCHDDWEGEYCHRIICHHGSADVRNKSMSCNCPKRYDGQHCDRCRDIGKPVSPYPECGPVTRRATMRPPPRKQATKANTSRAFFIVGSCILLIVILIVFALISWWYRSSMQERTRQTALQSELTQRRNLLEEAAKQANGGNNDELNGQATVHSQSGRIRNLRNTSFGSLFKLRTTQAPPLGPSRNST